MLKQPLTSRRIEFIIVEWERGSICLDMIHRVLNTADSRTLVRLSDHARIDIDTNDAAIRTDEFGERHGVSPRSASNFDHRATG